MNPTDDVVITGIGLVSSLGEGNDVHWRRLSEEGPQPVLDETRFRPYLVHPLPPIDWSLQIAKRGDQRQMETWQRLGTYAAGLALDDAGMKDEVLRASMDMIVAAGGGERDEAVDAGILQAAERRNDREVLLNERLSTELRPTLFLAQLSNLLAGNISIVHKVTGSSRTFMGEEGAGISAVESAAARIRSGQSTHVLVGAAFQTEHHDMMIGYELAGFLHRGPWRSVWRREGLDGGGVVTGSGAAFLVLESRSHAEARERAPYARLERVVSDRIRRSGGEFADRLVAITIKTLGDRSELAGMLVVSGASGAHQATAAERQALAEMDVAARGMSSLTGHLKEAQFPFAVALAALAVRNREGYPRFDPQSERSFRGMPDRVLATTVGYHQFEGMALVSGA